MLFRVYYGESDIQANPNVVGGKYYPDDLVNKANVFAVDHLGGLLILDRQGHYGYLDPDDFSFRLESRIT